MKKYTLSILLSFILILSFGCDLLGKVPNNPSTDDLVTPPNNVNKVEPVIPDSSNGVVKYELGFGDYIATLSDISSSELENKYNQLSLKIMGDENGIFQTSYQRGLLDLFDYNNEVKLNINISKEELQIMSDYHNIKNEESYRRCSVDIAYKDIIIHFENVGIRQKGNTSRGVIVNGDGSLELRHYKISFSETFDDKYRIDSYDLNDEELAYLEERSLFGLEKIDIRFNRNKDATYLKEGYAYEIYRAMGLLAPRTNLANVSMNIDGNIQNAGIYLMVETIDKNFLKRNLLKDYTTGDLYKLGWSNEGASFEKYDDYLFGVETQYANGDGSFRADKYPYDLKTNKKTSNHSDIKEFIKQLINANSNNVYDVMQEYSYYDYYITYMAISYLIGDPDDLRGNHNNTYVYFVPSADGVNKIIFIPTDHDRAFGSTGGAGGNPTGDFCTDNGPFSPQTGYSRTYNPLFYKTIINSGDGVNLGNDQIKKDYIKKIEEVISKKWMDIATFKYYFAAAKEHYADDLVLGNLFTNQDVLFNLIENEQPNGDWNLSIEVYLRLKVDTFNRKKPS